MSLTLEANARLLLAHEDLRYAEWGAGGAMRIQPDVSGQGLSVTLAPTWGVATAATERLWTIPSEIAPAATAPDPAARLEGEIGYGFAGGQALESPHVGWQLAHDERVYILGYGYRLGQPPELNLDARRREPVSNKSPEHEIELRGEIRW